MTKESPELRARKRLAANVLRRRGQKALTQDQLAARANIVVRHLQKIEAAQVNLTLRTLCGLAGALEIEPGLLLDEKAD